MTNRAVLVSLIALVLAFSSGVQAQAPYPNRPVKFVVPFLAGGAPDVVARILANEMTARFGQPFIVENRAGTGGGIGAAYVAKSAPDGYTLFFATEAPLVINPHLYTSLGYDPVKDFVPITMLVKTAFYVIVCPKVPVNTLAELAEHARKQRITYASTGHGTTMNMAGEMLKKRLGFDMTHVPYKGVPPAMADIMNCSVDVGFGAFGSALPLIKSGKVKALAISTVNRVPETPEVPTLRESGFANLEQIESSFSLLAPVGTPQPIIDLIYAESVRIMNTPAIKERMRERGITVMTSSSPSDFADWISAATRRYKTIIDDAKIKIE
jgi:tripartite-type tricarboxylate transporter receptor subunit TctC